jgi:hypothetical protein
MLLRIATGALMLALAGMEPTRTAAEDRPFNLTRERITFSAERAPVDIEIMGSTSLLPKAHRLLPQLALRLRLERAYVYNFMSKQEPGFEILGISVDVETGLPASLFETAALRRRFGDEIPEVRQLPSEELRRRHVQLTIHSDYLAASLGRINDRAFLCRGPLIEDGLWSYASQQDANCPRVFSNEIRYIGMVEDRLWVQIDCDKTSGPTWSRCSTEFPFDGFAVGLNFSQQLLPRWRKVVGFAESFLDSKRYRESSP